jgi:transposase
MDAKKKTMHATEQETLEVKEARKNYRVWLWSVVAQRLVFIDETGMKLNMTRTHARSGKGMRAKSDQQKAHSEHVTMIGAMALSGVLTSVLFKGGTDTNAFLAFVEQFLLPVLWEGAIVVMDNLNVHRNEAVKALIESVKATVVFLPTYSPDFNPIELLWSKLKAFIRKHKPRSREALEQVVAQALDSVSTDDILGWFSEAEYRAIFD